jgi:hypothetical protein
MKPTPHSGAAYFLRSAIELAIEKYENTAMQWLHEQPQNN